MGQQVIRQPDGKLAIFSSVVDAWVVYDASPDEVVAWFAEAAADDAARGASRVVAAVVSGDPRSVYRQFALSFERADAISARSTGRTLEEERALFAASVGVDSGEACIGCGEPCDGAEGYCEADGDFMHAGCAPHAAYSAVAVEPNPNRAERRAAARKSGRTALRDPGR